MELKISDLPPQFENIAIELGIDKIKSLFKEFGGISVYFPIEKMIYKEATHLINIGMCGFYILLFNSLIFEFKELIPILKLSSLPSIRTSKYIVTIDGKPKLATNYIKSSSNDIFL